MKKGFTLIDPSTSNGINNTNGKAKITLLDYLIKLLVIIWLVFL